MQSLNSFLFYFYSVYFFPLPMVVREAVVAYTIHHFMVKLGWVRHKFNCFFSLLPSRWRIMHDYGSGTNVHVKLTRWRFFIVVSTTRLPTENGKWGRQAERTRRKKKDAKFYTVNLQIGQITSRYKNVQQFFRSAPALSHRSLFFWCDNEIERAT